MRELMEQVRRISIGDIPVLLVGESGSGKDLLARTIHSMSSSAKGPFVSEVCAVPETLLESELFGFVRGAFTDAVEDRPGLLQLCNGGTLYLDEISHMSADLQARLLKVLDDRKVRPIGSDKSVQIKFRLISSSQRSIQNLKDSGSMRLDFLWRVSPVVLDVPPLRERREDIPLLVQIFAQSIARERGAPTPEIDRKLIRYLEDRDWPGNVRQLENEVRRAFLIQPERMTMDSYQKSCRPAGDPEAGQRGNGGKSPARRLDPPLIPLRSARKQLERRLILEALQAHGGNASGAARSLGITRRYLGTLMEKHGIRLSDFNR